MQSGKETMCIASMKTITSAHMARKALASAGIVSNIVSIDPNITRKGCAYGIGFNCGDAVRVKRVLKEKGIAYGEIFGG